MFDDNILRIDIVYGVHVISSTIIGIVGCPCPYFIVQYNWTFSDTSPTSTLFYLNPRQYLL